MAETITIELTDSEAAEFLEVGQAVNPGASGAELREWATVVAKNGLRTEVGRYKLETIRQQESEARSAELASFSAAWPETPLPGDVIEDEVR